MAIPNEAGNDPEEHLTAQLGKRDMIPSHEIVTTSEAQDKHLKAFEKGCAEWEAYHDAPLQEEEMEGVVEFVTALLSGSAFTTEAEYNNCLRLVRKELKITPSKPQIVRAYTRLRDAGQMQRHAPFERIVTKKAVRSNSGVVVITVVTAPGKFSCPADCHYCPDEPGQPRSYLSTEPAVARANQNNFDPVLQFWDRAGTLAKQGHTVDKIEIIVLGGTWSYYPLDYQEEFCRDLFYAANTFDEHLSKMGERGEGAANVRPRRLIQEEQEINERSKVKIIGLTLETRPDHITVQEVKRFRRYGCTRVQIGIQHTDDDVLRYVNRGHLRKHAVEATRLLKTCGFKVDIHLMPDLPTSDPEKDWIMFDDVLHGEDLQADHWKVYPCEVTPFTRIEKWYQEGRYTPYAETEPEKLVELLVKVKAAVHPWIRLNRVIRDIPEVSIIAGNACTNLRQVIFKEMQKRGQSCRCIRCREVRDWPETADKLRLRVREYRSSGGTEYFITIEGGPRGLGGGATQRSLAGGKKATRKEKKKAEKAVRNGEVVEEDIPAAEAAAAADAHEDNAALYGLLRLRLNDDAKASGKIFPELEDCALIRELHVYGALVAARVGESSRDQGGERAQHLGIGRTLMGTAELIAASRGWRRISVIAGVGVRHYYRRLGYSLRGEGQYLVKELEPCTPIDGCCPPTRPVNVWLEPPAKSFETSFLQAAARLQKKPRVNARTVAAVTLGVAAISIAMLALGHRWRRGRS